jgi:hypothetical protein
MNEQLSRLTPFSQQVAPDLAWRTQQIRIITDWFCASYFYLDPDVGVKSKLTHLVPPGR